MRRVTQLFLLVALAALLTPAVASAAPRMYVGFHDDPNFRYETRRAEMLDQAKAANATIVRTLVTWANIAPTRPANASNPFDSAYRFQDLDELVRNTQERDMEVLITIWGTPKWANGGKTPNYAPTRMSDLTAFARAVAIALLGPLLRLSVRALLLDLERVEPAALPGAAVRREGQVGRAAHLRQARRRRLRGDQGGQLAREGRRRQHVVGRPRQAARRQVGHALPRPLRAARRGGEPAPEVRRLGAAPVSGAGQPEADPEGASGRT